MTAWLRRHTSELIGAGLMLASSGLDGIYMTLWMPTAWWWLGLVLNTMADITDLYLGQRVGSLLRSSDSTRRWGALVVFAGQLVAILFSWFYSWRQLLRVLPAIEPEHYTWIAPVAAGCIPLLLAILGIESGLSSFSTKRFLSDSDTEAEASKPPEIVYFCPVAGCNYTAPTKAAINGHQRAHSNGRTERERVEVA